MLYNQINDGVCKSIFSFFHDSTLNNSLLRANIPIGVYHILDIYTWTSGGIIGGRGIPKKKNERKKRMKYKEMEKEKKEEERRGERAVIWRFLKCNSSVPWTPSRGCVSWTPGVCLPNNLTWCCSWPEQICHLYCCHNSEYWNIYVLDY